MRPNPGAILRARVAPLLEAMADGPDTGLAAFADEIDRAPRVFTAGTGRSGLAARALAMRLAQMGWAAHVAGEATAPALRGGDALVLFTNSGRTSLAVRCAEVARREGARTLLVTGDSGCPLEARADRVFRVPVARAMAAAPDPGRDRVPLEPASLFELGAWLAGDLLAAMLRERRGLADGDLAARHANLE